MSGVADAEFPEFFAQSSANAPDVLHFGLFEHGGGCHEAACFGFFGNAVGEFGQGLGGAEADGYGDAGPLFDGVSESVGKVQWVFHFLQMQEGFVNGIDFNGGGKSSQDGGDPTG